MNNWVLAINTVTNAFFLNPLFAAYARERWLTCALIASSFFASCAMHISETKHHLNPHRTLLPYSTLFLNIDRFLGFLMFLNGLSLAYQIMSFKLICPGLLFLVGVGSCLVGELTQNWTVYTIAHTIWHYAASTSLQMIIEM